MITRAVGNQNPRIGLAPLTAVDGRAYDYSRSFNYKQKPIVPAALPAPIKATPVTVTPVEADDPT